MKKLLIILPVLAFMAAGCNTKSNVSIAPSNPNTYGQDPIADLAPATPATFNQKQQCSKDAQAWYQKNVEDGATPRAIYESNLKYSNSEPSLTVSAIYPGQLQYVYSTKLNTCLVDYSETVAYMDGSTFTSHTIEDVYTNKSIADWSWSQKVGQSLSEAIKKSDATSFNTAEYNLIQQQK